MPSIDLSPIEIPNPTLLNEVRTSKMRPLGSVLSGIDKQPREGSLFVSKLGLDDDEHDLTFHGGVDKAIHQYCSKHYELWQSWYPDKATGASFAPGGFGENLVAEGFSERNVCIGDLVQVGEPSADESGRGCLLEVSLPRQPCFKLNQRFGIKNFAPQTHQKAMTGWYYRVIQEGHINPGMQIRIIKRDHPRWSIARLHHYVHRDKEDLDVCQELMNIPVIGKECRNVFETRWKQHLAKQVEKEEVWRPFRLASKTRETSRIVRLQLDLESPRKAAQSSHSEVIPVGSYASIKLSNGLKRNYSVVEGSKNSFVLGVALDDNSRGGSAFIHKMLQVGDTVLVGNVDRSGEPSAMASHSIFIVGGIGITAFLAQMKRQLATNLSFELHYAVRSAEEVAFSSLLQEFGTRVKIYDKSKGQRIDIVDLVNHRRWNSHIYTCGPQRMIDAVIAAGKAAGMPQEEVHFEKFTADTTGDPFSVKILEQGEQTKSIQVPSDQSLLEALKEVGLEMASSCEVGTCGTCRISLVSGKVLHRGSALTEEEQKAEILACVSRGIGEITVEV